MDLLTAQRLMSIYERIGREINEADSLIRMLPDAERSEHLEALAGMIGHLWSRLQAPIVQEHAELDPDAGYFESKSSSTVHPRSGK